MRLVLQKSCEEQHKAVGGEPPSERMVEGPVGKELLEHEGEGAMGGTAL